MTNISPRLRHTPASPRIALIGASLITGVCMLAACGITSSGQVGALAAAGHRGQQRDQLDARQVAAQRTRPLIGLTSATFISDSTGWLLGVKDCGRPACTIQLRRTTDGGRRWSAVTAPPAPAFIEKARADSVSQVTFADSADGWAFDPGLWATHDGGASWHRVSTHGMAVTSLAASDGRAVAVFSPCRPDATCARPSFRVWAAAVTGGGWRPVSGAAGRGFATVVTAGRRAYASVGPAGGFGRPRLLAGPVSGTRRWQAVRVPCPQVWGVDGLALGAAPRGTLVLGCAGQPGAGSQVRNVYLSADAGRTWRELAAAPDGGYLGQVSITPAGTVFLSGERSDVYIHGGGRGWHTSPSLNRADIGDGLIATVISNKEAFVLQASPSLSQIWLTCNDGRTWKPVTVR
jgi:hypothetical protein